MKASNILGLRRSSAKAIIDSIVIDQSIDVELSSKLPIGQGRRIDELNGQGRIIVGTGNLFKGVFNNKIDDLSFVTLGVSIFHELEHYRQDTDVDVSTEIAISSLGLVGNRNLYELDRVSKPHEIQAEFAGVMNMWDLLAEHYDDRTVSLSMVNYLNIRCDPDNETYYFSGNDGFMFSVSDSVRGDVIEAFDKAYDRSLNGERHIITNLSRLSDETARLVQPGADFGDPVNRFAPFYVSLYNSRRGVERDSMLAACVLHLRPEWKDRYRVLKDVDLSMAAVFGQDFPETTYESRRRLGIGAIHKNSKPTGLQKDMYSSVSFDLAARSKNISMMDRFKSGLEVSPGDNEDDNYVKY
ncbi:MAG: hypothetical protein HDQ88_00960 [Clostridia bacterium]|nr:hypothetical protein [Clostridia bacterium]